MESLTLATRQLEDAFECFFIAFMWSTNAMDNVITRAGELVDRTRGHMKRARRVISRDEVPDGRDAVPIHRIS